MESSDIVQVKLTFRLPETKCMFTISTKYPDLQFKNISMLPTLGNAGNTLIEVNGARSKELVADLKREKNISAVKVLLDSEDQVLINARINEPLILNLMSANDVIIDYPMIIQDGEGSITLIGERPNIDALLETFEAKGISYTIKSIGGIEPDEILSEKQKEVLTKSLKAGFFDVPRKMSLTDLAAEFDVSPTALSEMIRRLSKRLAEHYVNPIV
jgi:predicted DNA binding protein